MPSRLLPSSPLKGKWVRYLDGGPWPGFLRGITEDFRQPEAWCHLLHAITSQCNLQRQSLLALHALRHSSSAVIGPQSGPVLSAWGVEALHRALAKDSSNRPANSKPIITEVFPPQLPPILPTVVPMFVQVSAVENAPVAAGLTAPRPERETRDPYNVASDGTLVSEAIPDFLRYHHIPTSPSPKQSKPSSQRRAQSVLSI